MSILTPPDFLRTYDPPQEEYRDGGQPQVLDDYQAVQDYVAEHPDAGRTEVGRALDLPASRVRGWMTETMPDAVRGLHVAQDHGWIPLDYDSPTFGGGINVLMAWVYSSGAITTANYRPVFSVSTDSERDRVAAALDVAGATYELVRDTDDDRAGEVRVTRDATVLGRVLAALGAPLGTKNPDTAIALPDYLDAPDTIRCEFVTTYLSNRLARTDGAVGLREERSREYLTDLADLVSDVFDVDTRISEKNVYLDEWPADVPTS